MSAMHGRSVLVLGGLAAAGLAASGLAAYAGAPVETHLLLAVLSFLLLVFAHSWMVLYLFETARVIRELAAGADLPPELLEPGSGAAKRALPWALAVAALVAANTVIGGRLFAHATPGWVHALLAWATFVVQAVAVWAEARLLAGHNRRMLAVNALLRA